MNLLTVIMPVYNGEMYLEEAIDSILNQTFTDFKLLVLNDNSTDSTPSILEAYQKKDNRVEVINKTKNEGPANLRNEGIESAQTEFIALMDADDISLPTRFEKQLDVFKNNANIGVCGTWFTFFGDKQKLIKHAVDAEALKVQFLSSCGIGNPTVMFRTSAIKDFRFEHQYVPAEDYGLWSEVIQITDFYNIPESLLNYRWHPNNISQTKEKNLQKANVLIKKKQLLHFGIDESKGTLDDYFNAVSLNRNLSPEQITSAIEASKALKARNNETNYYNHSIFESHIDKVIIRTIRNASSYNKTFYNYVKNESGYFNQIPFIDKMVFLFKSLF
ncbi:glycosyltransferase family 2 protein [Psychroserpens ponticola]|uniref:Glycosyltransferase n=1 Tax=Psychroserpens ponticola TaxID=2932268 RepID=A0ABY7S1H5_9FLAO|nr:glycosyltransferase family 2 protein [Psychroserpens ponticola]WCO02983.1 glycosyltransferase [Psychroserpens ponticola]